MLEDVRGPSPSQMLTNTCREVTTGFADVFFLFVCLFVCVFVSLFVCTLRQNTYIHKKFIFFSFYAPDLVEARIDICCL